MIEIDTALIYKNYKEPLTKVPNGYGYMGTVAQTLDGTGIQCHQCGKTFKALPSHIKTAHNLTDHQYKEKYELAYSTALASDSYRYNMRQKSTAKWMALSMDKKCEMKEKQVEGLKAYNEQRKVDGEIIQPHMTLETRNKRGICKDQLLAKITEVQEAVGHTPSLRELMKHTGGQRYKHIVYSYFGSWKRALAELGLEPRKPASDSNRGKKRVEGSSFYSAEELLELLRIFVEENHRIPTSYDLKVDDRFPAEDTYIRRFGSLSKAREIAGIEPVELVQGYGGGYREAIPSYLTQGNI